MAKPLEIKEISDLFSKVELVLINGHDNDDVDLVTEVESIIQKIDLDELMFDLLKNKYEEFKKYDPEMSGYDLDLMVMDSVRSKLFFID